MNSIKIDGIGANQGDVPILRIDKVPAGIKMSKKKEVVVALGESTGHRHIVQGDLMTAEDLGRYYFVVGPKGASMVHTGNEHETIELEVGQTYFVPKDTQREYDGEQERRVAD